MPKYILYFIYLFIDMKNIDMKNIFIRKNTTKILIANKQANKHTNKQTNKQPQWLTGGTDLGRTAPLTSSYTTTPWNNTKHCSRI